MIGYQFSSLNNGRQVNALLCSLWLQVAENGEKKTSEKNEPHKESVIGKHWTGGGDHNMRDSRDELHVNSAFDDAEYDVSGHTSHDVTWAS